MVLQLNLLVVLVYRSTLWLAILYCIFKLLVLSQLSHRSAWHIYITLHLKFTGARLPHSLACQIILHYIFKLLVSDFLSIWFVM